MRGFGLCLLWLFLPLLWHASALGAGNGYVSGTVPDTGKAWLDSWKTESERFADLYELLEKDFRKFGNSEKMVKNIFYRTHQKLFLRYQQFTLDRDALDDGLYDCVSGSLILATLLDHFGFAYDVKETSYHVFLQVEVEGSQLLLEVTDPQAGFISDPERKQEYLSDITRDSVSKALWSIENREHSFASPDIYRTIDLQNLLGLQYFNQSIWYFNEGNPLAAYQFSVTALKYHNSERIREFRDFLKQELVLAAN